jgi:hypothetical protein
MRDETVKHTAHFLPSCQMVSNRLNHARAYSYWALPSDNLSTGRGAHCAWEESQRMSHNQLATRSAGPNMPYASIRRFIHASHLPLLHGERHTALHSAGAPHGDP